MRELYTVHMRMSLAALTPGEASVTLHVEAAKVPSLEGIAREFSIMAPGLKKVSTIHYQESQEASLTD